MGWSSWPRNAVGRYHRTIRPSFGAPSCCCSRRGAGRCLDPNEVADRLSAAYLIAVNARTVSEVGAIASAAATGTRLPTLTVDTVIGFSRLKIVPPSLPTWNQPSPRWSPDTTTTTGGRTV